MEKKPRISIGLHAEWRTGCANSLRVVLWACAPCRFFLTSKAAKPGFETTLGGGGGGGDVCCVSLHTYRSALLLLI